jgi:hypothetical protein
MTPIALRVASSGDDDALRRLAELDSRPLPPGPHLVAARAGRVDAALSLSTGAVVADPFRPTAELTELLRFAALRRGRRRAGRGVRARRTIGATDLPLRPRPA